MTTATARREGPDRLRLLVAFASIYLVWGSTYLAIKIGLESLPPLMLGGLRHLAAGALLFAGASLRRRAAAAPAAAPEPASRLLHWRNALIAGGLMLLGGNGGVCWAETRVPSGPTALVVALVPLFIVILEALRPGGRRPGRRVLAGLALGFVGLAILVGPEQLVGAGRLDPLGAGVLVFATLSWASGSIFGRHAAMPRDPLRATAMQMLGGGALLVVVALMLGEGARLRPAEVSARSWAALAYLVVFGSIVAFTAYVWLMRVSTPSKVSTYAYVNPIVAVLLGWGLGGEALAPRTLLACVVIVGGVVLLTWAPARPSREPVPAANPAGRAARAAAPDNPAVPGARRDGAPD